VAQNFSQTITSQTLKLDLSKSTGGPRTLVALCTDLFLIVIRMREAEDLGDPAALNKLIRYFIQLFQNNCKAIGRSPEHCQEALYAIVALLDETILSIPGPCRDFWFGNPLQLELFGDNIAGNEFYNKLQKIMLEPEKKKEVLEIYFLCLTLGFEGKYKMAGGDERNRILEDTGRTLRRLTMRASSGLSPHGQPVGTSSAQVKKGRRMPLWLFASSSTALVIVVWIALGFASAAFSSSIKQSLLAIFGQL
jgi:type VI secretion system protein ImpK